MNAENEKPKSATARPIDKFIRTGPNDARCPNCGQVSLRCRAIDPTAKPNSPHLRICCGVSFDTRDLWEAQCHRSEAANSKVLSGLEATEIHGGVALTYFGVPISVDLRSASELEMARSVIQTVLSKLRRTEISEEASGEAALIFRKERDELISAIGAHQVYGDATFPEALKMAKDLRDLASPPDCQDGAEEKPAPPKLFVSPPPFQRVEPLPAAKSEGLTTAYVQALERRCGEQEKQIAELNKQAVTLELRANVAEKHQRALLKRCDDRDDVIDNYRIRINEEANERHSLAKMIAAKDAELGLLESKVRKLESAIEAARSAIRNTLG